MTSSREESVDKRLTVTWLQWLLAAVIGSALSLGTWWGLATGGGLVGGDTYTYFMPQKVVLAEAFTNGEIPLWHNLTGLGYPLHAESQAGVFYPSNQILYRVFDINTAYNVSILLHYALAFVFAWRFVRCQMATQWPALLAAAIYVYGWFPARVSLEWSIIGGLWLPLCLWQTDRLIERASWRRFSVLALCLGCHLLAGHFALAFICQLTLVGYAALKLFFCRSQPDQSTGTEQPPEQPSGRAAVPSPVKPVAMVIAAIFSGLAVASVQLLPTYELKQNSQREGVEKEFNPAYGHMPPLYVSQLVASWWYWHTPEIIVSRQMRDTPGTIDAETNAVEAHLYFGLIPLLLLCLLLNKQFRQGMDRPALKIWACLSLAALLYATGWLMPVTRHLPGFAFFMGPGRYTIVAALGGSILVALSLDQLLSRSSAAMRVATVIAIGLLTLPDLAWSSNVVTNAVVVERPPMTLVDQSWLKKTLQDETASTPRLLAPGPNLCNLLGTSCVPQYLGIGPAVYYTDALQPPTGPANEDDEFPSSELLMQLQSLGITHIVTLNQLRRPADAIELVNAAPDAILNTVWGRGRDSCFLYRVVSIPQRHAVEPAAALTSFELMTAEPGHVIFEVNLADAAEVSWRELMYPGWRVTVDGREAEPTEGLMRTVRLDSGRHTVEWRYWPSSFMYGAAFSGLTLLLLIFAAVRPSRRN